VRLTRPSLRASVPRACAPVRVEVNPPHGFLGACHRCGDWSTLALAIEGIVGMRRQPPNLMCGCTMSYSLWLLTAESGSCGQSMMIKSAEQRTRGDIVRLFTTASRSLNCSSSLRSSHKPGAESYTRTQHTWKTEATQKADVASKPRHNDTA